MKHLKAFCVILCFFFAGELLQALIPLPIPAAIYGLLLLLGALCCGLIKAEKIESLSSFLLSIMPVLFVAPAVGILEHWPLIQPYLLPLLLLIVLSTVLTFGVSGKVTDFFLQRKGGEQDG